MGRETNSKMPQNLKDYQEESKFQKIISKERTLARIIQGATLDSKINTWGVVIDISKPANCQTRNLWCSKLKIIDHTFNCDQQTNNSQIRFFNYAIVNIYSTDQEELPRIDCLGDLIRLRRFNWVVSEHGELMGFMQKFSNWMTFSGNGTNTVMLSNMSLPSNQGREFENFEKQQLNELRRWTKSFFGERSVRQVCWWKKSSIISDHSGGAPMVFKNVDLVLKVKETERDGTNVKFSDEKDHVYSYKCDKKMEFKEGQVIKLRGGDVTIVGKNRILHILQTSSTMIIPPGFLDAKGFDPEFLESNQQKFEVRGPSYRWRNLDGGFLNKEAVLSMYPFLKNYYYEEHLINKPDIAGTVADRVIVSKEITIVNKDYFNKVPIKLDFLAKLRGVTSGKLIWEKFTISCKIIDVKLEKMEEVYRLFCEKCSHTKNFTTENQFKCCGKISQLCMFFKILVADESMCKNESFPVYVLARVQNKNPLSLWRGLPDLDDADSWGCLQKGQFENLKAKMNSIVALGCFVKLCVQAKRTEKGKKFLELCDTFFLP